MLFLSSISNAWLAQQKMKERHLMSGRILLNKSNDDILYKEYFCTITFMIYICNSICTCFFLKQCTCKVLQIDMFPWYSRSNALFLRLFYNFWTLWYVLAAIMFCIVLYLPCCSFRVWCQYYPMCSAKITLVVFCKPRFSSYIDVNSADITNVIFFEIPALKMCFCFQWASASYGTSRWSFAQEQEDTNYCFTSASETWVRGINCLLWWTVFYKCTWYVQYKYTLMINVSVKLFKIRWFCVGSGFEWMLWQQSIWNYE